MISDGEMKKELPLLIPKHRNKRRNIIRKPPPTARKECQMGWNRDMGTFHELEFNHSNILFSLVFLSSMLLFLLFGRRKAENGLPLPPGLFTLPIIGNILDLDFKNPHISMAKLAESFGPLFSLRIGSRLFIVASDATASREIFKFHDRELSGRYLPQIARVLPELKNSAIAMSGECSERWRLLRSIGHTELFSSRALESHSETRVKKVSEMLEFLNSKDGQPVKIADVVFATVVNILTEMMVSQDIVKGWSHSEEMQKTVRSLIHSGAPGLADLYPALFWLDFGVKQRVKDVKETNRRIWGDALSERKRKHELDACIQSQDFLDALAKNSLGEYETCFLLTEFLVTSEPTTTLIEWAMAELIGNGDAFAKLRVELEETTQGTALREHHLNKLPYLQACIKEAFRLHPPNPFLVPRVALQTCHVLNYRIPKSAVVLLNAHASGRDPMTWEDPLSFKPERFLNKSIDLKGTSYELLPFGGGRRLCPGYLLALKDIQLILASLVHAFDWSFPPGIDSKLDMTETFDVALRKEKQLQLIPKKRDILKVKN